MAEPTEGKTPTEEVGDDDLSTAWDSVKTDTKEEKKEVVEVPEQNEEKEKRETESTGQPSKEAITEKVEAAPEVLDQKESSKLGRKYKGLELEIQQLKQQLAQALSPKTAESEIEVPEVISTPEDIDKYLEAKNQRAQRDNQQYENGYLGKLREIEKENEDTYDEVFAEMMQNFNVRHSKDPVADAQINYYKAQAAVLKKKTSVSTAPKVPERDTSSKAPVQPAASASRSTDKVAVLPKLDKETQGLVDDWKRRDPKITDAEILEMLRD